MILYPKHCSDIINSIIEVRHRWTIELDTIQSRARDHIWTKVSSRLRLFIPMLNVWITNIFADININDVDHRRPNNSHSSLMCSTVDNRSCSSEADEELSDDEPMQLSSGVDFAAAHTKLMYIHFELWLKCLRIILDDSGSVLRSTGRQGSSSKNDRIDRVWYW
jgi:hypothetical protein